MRVVGGLKSGMPDASESDAVSEVWPVFWLRLEVGFGFGSCATVVVEPSVAAKRSLSSWYFRRDSRGRTPFSRYNRRETRVWTTSSSDECSGDVSDDESWRSLRVTRKTRFWRYERKRSFLVSRRDIPFGGGWRVAISGRDVKADLSESVNVDSSSPGRAMAVGVVRRRRR